MDIIINLNVDPSSSEGLRIAYLSSCLQQLSNLYSVVDSTDYKEAMNSCLAVMANYILSEDTPAAISAFDDAISSIQTLKDSFFTAYGNWFKTQYNPPS